MPKEVRLSLETLSPGKHNPKLTEIRKAISHGALTASGLIVTEGPKLLEEALRSGLAIEAVFLRRGAVLPPVPATAVIYETDPAVFKTIQSTETSQGVVALVRPRGHDLRDLLAARNPLLVVLCRLQDPGNAGTILRVAESFGATGCLATAGTAAIFNPKTLRASAGSVFRIPHIWDLDGDELFAALRSSNIHAVGTAPDAGQTIGEWDWGQPSAIVIGNEGSGLSEEEKRMCDALVRIPHEPAVESLNSAIAASVVLYEASKQRGHP